MADQCSFLCKTKSGPCCGCNPKKNKWKWDELMKNFIKDHKEECRTVPSTNVREIRHKEYSTGSTYQGTWDRLGKCGHGIYTFLNGVVYVGEFQDSMFHGKGDLNYPNGIVVHGTWSKGQLLEKTLFFADGLQYFEDDWGYCKQPDRRFTIEYENGLQPSSEWYMSADQPTRDIPPGHYDTGDGFYDPKTKIIYNANDNTSIVRSAGPLEAKWITNYCRSNMEAPRPVGPRLDLYEEWSEPMPEPDPLPAPAAFGHDTETVAEDDNVSCASTTKPGASLSRYTSVVFRKERFAWKVGNQE